MIPAAFVQELLARVDIVEVVGRHVELKKAGINHKGLCPFHGEKTPSFIVSPTRQTYHCFGCGAHGDAIRFLTEQAGVSFVDAVHELSALVGLEVPADERSADERAQAAQRKAQQATLGDVLTRAAAHYRKQLKASERAIGYLKRRGLSGEVAARFGLGYAGDGWRTLAGVFPRYDDPSLVDAGLVIVQGEDEAEQKRYDRFRDRIMFPIRSVQGDVIGFGGRVIDSGEPKYLNSPETPLFFKGRELYGLHEARQAIRERGQVLVVEGYMDVVALAQHGFPHAVATLGTACTEDHVRKLFRFSDAVVFSFDGDAAGRRAAARALEAALPHASDRRTVRFLFLPPEHDPDSFVRSEGTQAFERCIADAVPLSRQMIDCARDGCDLTGAEGRARFLAQARPLWQSLPDGALRSQVLLDIAAQAQLGASEVAALWGQKLAPARPRSGLPRSRPRAPVRGPADNVARLLLLRSDWWLGLSDAQHDWLHRLPGWHGELFRWLDQRVHDSGPLPWSALREALGDAAWGGQARELVDASDPALEPLEDDLRGALDQLASAPVREEAYRVLGRA
jgi:DNA primase